MSKIQACIVDNHARSDDSDARDPRNFNNYHQNILNVNIITFLLNAIILTYRYVIDNLFARY